MTVKMPISVQTMGTGPEPWVFTTLEGFGGVPLNVVEGGNPKGRPVLFLHGLGRSYLDWEFQFCSPLAKRFRLIAFDLRGHGNSGKPWQTEEYNDSAIWAGDVISVMKGKNLIRPFLVAWSYGGVVALDYVRVHGVGNISGVNFIGNAPLLVSGRISPFPQDDQMSSSISRNIEGQQRIAKILTSKDLGESWRFKSMLIGMTTPAYVRRAIFERKVDYGDVIGRLGSSVHVSYGDREIGFTVDLPERVRHANPGISISIYSGIGHSPFVEDSERFNAELTAMVETGG